MTRPAQRMTMKVMTRATRTTMTMPMLRSLRRVGRVAIAALEFDSTPRSTGREAAAMSRATTMTMMMLMRKTTRLSWKIRHY